MRWLDGARDGGLSPDSPFGALAFDRADRRLTGAVLHDMNADVVALQEVHDLATLDYFHDRFLVRTGLAPYPVRVCLPGNDGMGRNLALLSRFVPTSIESHAKLVPADLGLAPACGQPASRPVFCRDCLIVRLGRLTLFLCHFKAPHPDTQETHDFRRTEAKAVRRLIERRFVAPADALWLVLGDLNELSPRVPSDKQDIGPLRAPFAVDLLERRPQGQRWSYHEPRLRLYSRPDSMLASPALASAWPTATPRLVREGMGTEAGLYPGPRLHGVGRHRPHASDHAAVMVDFDPAP